ncbi:MAG TPA: PepSY-associated TM helix domain-containing protein [Methylomirabilota bacterium]|nr:PepSY-associated TM helix domain-containing protein [Methylomirabilota bacterium]
MSVRPFVFWLHLVVGVTAGAVIGFMSVTGVLLAFEPQVTEWLERDRRIVVPPPGASRLPVDALVALAREARPDRRPSVVTLRADATAALVVSFGRDGGALFIDPYRGTVLGGFSRAHDLLHEVVEWHRWLGSHDIGRPITGAANLGFLGLIVLGVFLWWPRRWTRAAVRQVTVLDPRLRGRARDYNWHNVIGVWCAPVLLVLTLTGAVMSYRWANDLLYRLTGSEPPPPAAGPERPAPAAGGASRAAAGRERDDRPAERRAAVGLDALWARAERQVPGWALISLRVPARPDGPVTFIIQEPVGWHPFPRSQLTLDPIAAEVVRWEPFAGQSLGRHLRSWARPLHTGEAAGLAGQSVALAASGGAAVLAWTGLARAWRRFRDWRRRVSSAGAFPSPARTGQEVSAD